MFNIRAFRAQVEDEIERLVAILDALDGDPDLEPEPPEPSEDHCGGEDEYQDMEPEPEDAMQWLTNP